MSRQTSEHPNEPEIARNKSGRRHHGKYELWMLGVLRAPWRMRTYESLELAQRNLAKQARTWAFAKNVTFEIRIAK
jgi:hypothetical protein